MQVSKYSQWNAFLKDGAESPLHEHLWNPEPHGSWVQDRVLGGGDGMAASKQSWLQGGSYPAAGCWCPQETHMSDIRWGSALWRVCICFVPRWAVGCLSCRKKISSDLWDPRPDVFLASQCTLLSLDQKTMFRSHKRDNLTVRQCSRFRAGTTEMSAHSHHHSDIWLISLVTCSPTLWEVERLGL